MTISQNTENQLSPDSKSELLKHLKHLGKTPEEQIEKNQAAIDYIQFLLSEQIEDEEFQKKQESFEVFKKIIDDNRSSNQKLYSES